MSRIKLREIIKKRFVENDVSDSNYLHATRYLNSENIHEVVFHEIVNKKSRFQSIFSRNDIFQKKCSTFIRL